MNDIALWAPALLLLLFCLVYSLSAHHELYLPLPKGISDKLRNQHTVFLAMLCAFILAAAASLAEAVGGADALGLIHTAGVVFRVILFCLLALYTRALPKADRRASVLLTVVAATGVLVRAIWSAPIDLFFASVSVFGCKVMFERDTDAAENGMSDRFRLASMIAVTLVFLLGVAINVALMLNLTRAQADEIGRIQLRVLTGRILRLGDARLLREGEAPEEFARHIRAAGEALSLLSDDVQSYSEALFIEQEKDIQKKEKQGGSSIPTRRIRIGVVATLLVTLVVVMAFCVCISAGWGSTRLNRTTLTRS